MTLVCLGDVMADVLARLPGPLALGSDTPAAVRISGGGSAANTAAWAVAAGGSALFVGCVGDDPLGRMVRDELTAERLDLALSVDPGEPTGTCVVLIEPGGERTMIPSIGANASLRPEHLPARAFVAGNRLHVSGYALLGPARAAALAALERARGAGLPVSVGAGSAAPLRAVGAEQFLSWVGRDVLLFANRDEAAALTGRDDPAEAAGLLAERAGRAVVTCGASGALWGEGSGRPQHVPAPAVGVLDSTGAGDAFAAGMLLALAAGSPAPEAVQAGHLLAARACGVVGGRPGGPVSGGPVSGGRSTAAPSA
jgi:sugar/nucleoside kinase (ribokinase family)